MKLTKQHEQIFQFFFNGSDRINDERFVNEIVGDFLSHCSKRQNACFYSTQRLSFHLTVIQEDISSGFYDEHLWNMCNVMCMCFFYHLIIFIIL